ncbi:hypothetical protein Kpol_1059p13 [Vanderwaltozyma polyspora DSM 70294]|uniref:Vps72/YL1 C-terminal domain-containing protein n=1 Tax=Vanderwaltozyma polyspora (strain ATCC 22028 / DSM 70294 / BCRC 21397 / CBS 2163 / NBRC 10782 / NRRL Y-8283 / UCD 57-17) TaxID=436907 RepID=A7TN17_VANPO|nr:uncharacterized protein Kpol_1059p13 [Vanderwaltozyma polyspora DSM 70294]EDO16323.1 hypothetical protein Kpol_1059p13 [Vanderwaltozyma polyspora DSM 70294]
MSGTPRADSNYDARLEFLRTVAHQNLIEQPSKYKRAGYKKPGRRHKSSKQLVADEMKRLNNVEGNPKHNVTHFTVNAPPSLKPPKKYCDITGLIGKYKSPTNNIRYYNSEIFQLVVKPMTTGVDQQYLKLRGADFVLK